MNAKIVRTNSIVTAVMLLLYVGCGVLNMLLRLLKSPSVISLPSSMALCLAVLIPTVVLLIFGIAQAKKKQGKADLIFSVLTLVVSIVWIVMNVLDWMIAVFSNMIFEIYYRIDIDVPLGDVISFLSYLNIAYRLFTTVIALYLLAVFIIRVLCAKQKMLQIKAELHKPAAAVLMLVPNLLSLIGTFLRPVFARMGEEMLAEFSIIFSYVSFGITTLLAIALAVFVLVFGLIIKKKPQEHALLTQDVPQEEADRNADMPFDLPAGVNPDDL
jgi:hypothetical protein